MSQETVMDTQTEEARLVERLRAIGAVDLYERVKASARHEVGRRKGCSLAQLYREVVDQQVQFGGFPDWALRYGPR